MIGADPGICDSESSEVEAEGSLGGGSDPGSDQGSGDPNPDPDPDSDPDSDPGSDQDFDPASYPDPDPDPDPESSDTDPDSDPDVDPSSDSDSESEEDDEDEYPEKEGWRKQLLEFVLEEVKKTPGNFEGRERHEAKWARRSKKILRRIDSLMTELWEELGQGGMWELNCLQYAGARLAVANKPKEECTKVTKETAPLTPPSQPQETKVLLSPHNAMRPKCLITTMLPLPRYKRAMTRRMSCRILIRLVALPTQTLTPQRLRERTVYGSSGGS